MVLFSETASQRSLSLPPSLLWDHEIQNKAKGSLTVSGKPVVFHRGSIYNCIYRDSIEKTRLDFKNETRLLGDSIVKTRLDCQNESRLPKRDSTLKTRLDFKNESRLSKRDSIAKRRLGKWSKMKMRVEGGWGGGGGGKEEYSRARAYKVKFDILRK